MHRNEEDQVTATGDMYKNLVKFGRVVFRVTRADIQTNKQTNRHIVIAIVRIPLGGELQRRFHRQRSLLHCL